MEAESSDATAQDKCECEPVADGAWGNVGSSASAGAPAAGSEEARKNQQVLLEDLAQAHVRAYVKLLPEPTTIEGVKLAVRQSSASTIHRQDGRNVA